jgi:hypothetical protein
MEVVLVSHKPSAGTFANTLMPVKSRMMKIVGFISPLFLQKPITASLSMKGPKPQNVFC